MSDQLLSVAALKPQLIRESPVLGFSRCSHRLLAYDCWLQLLRGLVQSTTTIQKASIGLLQSPRLIDTTLWNAEGSLSVKGRCLTAVHTRDAFTSLTVQREMHGTVMPLPPLAALVLVASCPALLAAPRDAAGGRKIPGITPIKQAAATWDN